MDKKRIIKALSVLLCAIMLVGYVPAAAFAQTEAETEPTVAEETTEVVTEPVTEATEPTAEPVTETAEETAPQFLAEPGAQDPAAGEEGNLGSGTPDGTPPVLHSVTLSATTVTAPGQLEVTAEASDDVSGVSSVGVWFYCKETGKYLSVGLSAGYWEWDDVNYRDYWVTYADGKLHGTLEVDQYVESGTFRIDDITVHDNAGNSVCYEDEPYGSDRPLPEQVKNLSFDVIESDAPDGTPPVLHSVTLSATTVTAPGELEVIAEASDDVSGVSSVGVWFYCKETGKYLSVGLSAGYWEWDDVNYRDYWVTYADGKLHGTLEVDQYVESGTFRIDDITVHDNAGNSVCYEDEPYGSDRPLPEQVKNLQIRVRNVGADVITSVSKDSFVDDVAKADDNAYIVADFSGDATLDEDLFETIAGTNKTLDLTSDGITWRFNGQDITEDIKPVDLQVEILPVEEDSSPEGDGIQDSLENAPGVVMKFPENGVLPGKATIQVKVDYAMREYLGRSKGLCVYYYNNQTGEMELIAENLIVVNEGYVEFSITHCSDYVLTRDPNVVQNRLDLTGVDGGDILWVDGTAYDVQQENGKSYVDLPDGNANVLVTYSWHVGDPADVHTQYPTGMQVWILKLNEYGTYNKVRVTELDDILQYSGSSIRITGKKGIRMITSVEKYKKDALTSYGLSGFKLLEYGTLLSWASDLEGGKPLILGQEYAKSNYAYKKDVADPVFAYSGDLVQYTNVLVGFTNDQCKDDIAMRSYMILEDEQGQQYTIYGGIVYRSIGYIAWQNRGAFAPGSAAYAYVWEIIHHVYGDQFDEEYKG